MPSAKPSLLAPSRERAKLAEQAVATFRQSDTLDSARAAVERQQAYWADKIEQAIKPAEDHGTAMMYAQIRDRIANLEEKSRLAFIDKHIDDPVVISAVLSAPPFLSGLSDAEYTVVRHKFEKRVLSPEVFEAKVAAEKALADAERGWARAIDAIAVRGSLEKTAVAKVA